MGVKAILKSNESLGQKVKAIFKLKGVTIAAVFIAISLTISTIGLTISNALKAAGGAATAAKPAPEKPVPEKPAAEKPVPEKQSPKKEEQSPKKEEGIKTKEIAKKTGLAALGALVAAATAYAIKFLGVVYDFLVKYFPIVLIIIVGLLIFWFKRRSKSSR